MASAADVWTVNELRLVVNWFDELRRVAQSRQVRDAMPDRASE